MGQSDRSSRQMTGLLSNRLLSRVERLRLNAWRKFTNPARGEHLSGRGGGSIEFSDYRDYSPGDDIRFVDWNIFSRLGRPYLKLFHQEQDLHVVILVDGSASMDFEGKFDCARQLAAALGVMALFGTEQLSVWSFNGRSTAPQRLGPMTGRGHMRRLFGFLESASVGGDRPLDDAVEQVLKHHVGRGVAIVLSDFLTTGDIKRMFNLLYGRGLETFAVQVLSPPELNPSLNGDFRLVDIETNLHLDVSSAANLLGLYHEYRWAFHHQLEQLATRRRGRFMLVNTADGIDRIITDQMLRQGWVR